MITLVGRWENDIMSEDLELRVLRQLKGAYQVNRILMTPVLESMKNRANVEQFDTIEEALETCNGPIVFLEHKGKTALTDLLKTDDVTFVTGNAYHSNMHLADGHVTCKIKSAKPTDMFAVNAIAIALAYWYGQ